MRLRAASPLGLSRAERPTQSFANIPLELAPWETLDLPEPVARRLIEQTGGALSPTLKSDVEGRLMFPYQIRVRISCP